MMNAREAKAALSDACDAMAQLEREHQAAQAHIGQLVREIEATRAAYAEARTELAALQEHKKHAAALARAVLGVEPVSVNGSPERPTGFGACILRAEDGR